MDLFSVWTAVSLVGLSYHAYTVSKNLGKLRKDTSEDLTSLCISMDDFEQRLVVIERDIEPVTEQRTVIIRGSAL